MKKHTYSLLSNLFYGPFRWNPSGFLRVKQ